MRKGRSTLIFTFALWGFYSEDGGRDEDGGTVLSLDGNIENFIFYFRIVEDFSCSEDEWFGEGEKREDWWWRKRRMETGQENL